MKLSTLSIALGLGLALPQIYGLINPKGFTDVARKFPRYTPLGWVLMLAATAWFVWTVNQETDADFAAMKKFLVPAFAAIGVGTCIFVQDYLPVRGLAVLFMLLAKLMVDTGRPHLAETHWVLVIQSWAYVLVVGGIWFTISPHHLRDLINWATTSELRVRIGSALRLAFGLGVATLGLMVFH